MSAVVQANSNQLYIEIKGIHKLLAFKSQNVMMIVANGLKGPG